MSSETTENATPAPDADQPKAKRKARKKTKATRKQIAAKRAAARPKADRSNKKADVIALMKYAKGATLAEIMAVTKWQAHTVRGFLGSKGGEQIESSLNADGERTYGIK